MDNENFLPLAKEDCPQGKGLLQATAPYFHLESFIKTCIRKNLKGKRIINELNELNELNEIKINLTYQSLLNKIKAYKSAGLSAIIRKPRKDSDELRSFSPAVLQILQSEFVKHHVAIRAYEQTHKILRSTSIRFLAQCGTAPCEYIIRSGHLYEKVDSKNLLNLTNSMNFSQGAYITTDGEELLIGSYTSAVRYIKSFKSHAGDQLYFQRFGLANYRLKRQHKMKLDYSHMQPNDSWSLDNKQLDVYIMSDDLRMVYRPWLSGVYDAATRRYAFELASRPNSEAVAGALEAAMNSWGKPDEVVHDRGKDYLSARVQQLLSSLNITHRECEPRKANSKMIESFHNILDQHSKPLPGYTANKYQLCPEATKKLFKQHTKLRDLKRIYDKHTFETGDVGSELTLTLNQNLEARVLKSKNRFMTESELLEVLPQIISQYELTVQGGLKDDKLGRQVYNLNCKDELINSYSERLNTPAGRYAYHLELGYQPVKIDSTVLSLFAMNSAVRTVQLQGIQFKSGDSRWYFSPKLKSVIGKRVLIKFTKSNLNYLYIFCSDEIQKFRNTSAFKISEVSKTSEVYSGLQFICLAEKQTSISYGDKTFIERLHDQRAEEKMLKQSASLSSIGEGRGEVTHLTGLEPQIHELHAEVEEIVKSKSNKKTKYSETNLY